MRIHPIARRSLLVPAATLGLVNAIPYICDVRPGILTAEDLPSSRPGPVSG